jgi:hypothetical protein
MIFAIRVYQPVTIPGLVSMNMISKKQVPSLQGIMQAPGGFIIVGNWLSNWENEKISFKVFVPNANIQFAYYTGDSIEEIPCNLQAMPEIPLKATEKKLMTYKDKGDGVTFDTLLALCKSKGLKIPKKVTKKVLVELLRATLN